MGIEEGRSSKGGDDDCWGGVADSLPRQVFLGGPRTGGKEKKEEKVEGVSNYLPGGILGALLLFQGQVLFAMVIRRPVDSVLAVSAG